MLPHVAPRRTKCTVFGYAVAGAIERLPDHDPRQQRGEGHSRSYSKTNITASQATRMLLHVVAGQPACLDRPSPHKLPPERPRPVGPRKESPQSESAASSQAAGHTAFTAVFSCSGRMPSASIGPPGSWPCCPSTLRLSRCALHSLRRRRVRRSHHPAALSKPTRAPPPAALRGVLRSRAAATPQPVPAKRRAIFSNNQPITKPRPPHPKTV